MKKIFSIFLLSTLIFAIGCESEDDPRFQDNPETGWIEFASASTSISLAEGDPPISIPVNFTAPINLTDLNVSYSIIPISGDPSAIFASGNSLKIEGNTNTNNVILTPNTFSVLNLVLAGGDVVFDIQINSVSGDIPIGLSDGSAPTTHRVTVQCGGQPTPPPAGTYTIAMFDLWGDGWQTTAFSGGDGITVSMVDQQGASSVIEFGMCSSFGSGAGGTFLEIGDCTSGDGSFALVDIEIPEGMVSAEWYFPGDFFGEIGFIILYEGIEVYTTGTYGAIGAGPFSPEFCTN